MGIIHQKDRATINIYTSNIGACKRSKQILTDLKKEIYTTMQQDLNTLLSTMDRSSRQKTNIEKSDLNHTLD